MQGWGVAVLVGVPHKDAEFKTHPMNFLNERTLKGTFFGNFKPRTDLPNVVELYMKKVNTKSCFFLGGLPSPPHHFEETLPIELWSQNMMFMFHYSCSQELELEKFITHTVPFSEINKAFDLMAKGEGIRCIIRMDN
jgi:alcohol dehydrogenase class-P